MQKAMFTGIILVFAFCCCAQKIDSVRFLGDVKVTIDQPLRFSNKKLTRVILFALPNGNTTAQTMGKILQPGDDWHYDIQHIKAQTSFIRKSSRKENIIVCYLENQYKSWPLWKQKHKGYKEEITWLIDSLLAKLPGKNKWLELSSHSGGGSFIFGYLEGVKSIPDNVKRISFIDSNYGYDSSYADKLDNWLRTVSDSRLMVFAYNDSVALLNGKPVVSAKGGTWHRAHMMMEDLGKNRILSSERTDSIFIYQSPDKKLAFFLKPNPDRRIYHTQQVEYNGFIHASLYGTKRESKGYSYYGKRSYTRYISGE